MSEAFEEVMSWVGHNGWALLPESTPHQLILYRFKGTIRIEVRVLFDEQGRVYNWSVWHNMNVIPPDRAAGRRRRLIARLAAGALR